MNSPHDSSQSPGCSPARREGIAAWEDSYRKAADLGAKVVTMYCSLAVIEADRCALNYFSAMAHERGLELAVELEAPAPPGVLRNLPADLIGLDDYLGKTENLDQLAPFTALLTDLVATVCDQTPTIMAGTVVTYHNALANGHAHWVADHFGPVCDVVGVTFYPEFMPKPGAQLGIGYSPELVSQQIDGLFGTYGGPWDLALLEGGISAHPWLGGGEAEQVQYMTPHFDALGRHASMLAFASAIFAVFPLQWGEGQIADWVAGLSVYRADGSARPVRDAVLLELAGP